MEDWSREIGDLYGAPCKLSNGWGIAVYPTAQQEEQITKLHHEACDRGDYNADHLRGRNAVSFDSGGKERPVMITDSAGRGSRYDMDGNEMMICECTARATQSNYAAA